jgi:transcription-repair coupling factor (superfamily II helicase)
MYHIENNNLTPCIKEFNNLIEPYNHARQNFPDTFLHNGNIDIVIGTHSLLAKKVEFKNLGLLIIDDEQRFGVKQKELLRKQNPALDVLYLSATPIPRTMYLALSSLKKISFIQTPPEGRKAVKTFIGPFHKETIKKAIADELKRGGQAYFLHNRVQTMLNYQKFLEALDTKARIGILHAKLPEKNIIKTMTDFQQGQIDVLLSTTIIENGLDIANANTLIVDDATRLGLAQAYQLRGRIGRSTKQSFAYFLYPKGKLKGLAKRRLAALKQAEELGSGYKIAVQDMEIRGAGNILGKEQSGSVNKVGLNLYCQMLSEAVERLKSSN